MLQGQDRDCGGGGGCGPTDRQTDRQTWLYSPHLSTTFPETERGLYI